MKNLIEQSLAGAQDYSVYRNMLTELLDEGKTTGSNQSPAFIDYASLNQKRMDRLDKRTKLREEMITLLGSLKQSYLLLTLTEGWCGDAAQVLPVLNKVAEQTNKVNLKVILRDEHPDLMDQFLTNGGRSIPKVIILDPETLEVKGSWGPRPNEAQDMMLDFKNQSEPKESYEEFQIRLHTWYARDKTHTTQVELSEVFKKLEQG